MAKTLRRAAEILRTRVATGRAWLPNSQYVAEAPSHAQTVRLFSGWSSHLPLEGVVSGPSELFNDQRIAWLLEELQSIQGWRILELGPLEAGHTYMLERAGASEIVAVEANTEAYLKCLVVKELLSMNAAKFLLGDFNAAIESMEREFDLVVASGVLYHLEDPLATLRKLVNVSDSIFIWSHFFDNAAMPRGDPRRRYFTGRKSSRAIEGDALTYYERSYLGGEKNTGFCGGSKSNSVWLDRAETIAFLEKRDFVVTTAFDDPQHVGGPAVCLLARRKSAGSQKRG